MPRRWIWTWTWVDGMGAIAYLGSLLWALWIINPWGSQFADQAGLKILRLTGEMLVGAESARYLWGGCCLLATMAAIILSLMPTSKRTWGMKRVVLAILFVFWTWVAVSFISSNFWGTGAIAYWQYALTYGWLFLVHRTQKAK